MLINLINNLFGVDSNLVISSYNLKFIFDYDFKNFNLLLVNLFSY